MARQARANSPTEVQHVTARGAGKRIIFEDDFDRIRYLQKLEEYAARDNVSVIAWCLMDNHVHLLLKCDVNSLKTMMRSLGISHAQWFNGHHGHIGPVFQGRYSSSPIENDAHLLECVRYIHKNPATAGVAETTHYRWSSYGEYIGKHDSCVPEFCDTTLVLSMLDDFVAFHERNDIEVDFMELVPNRPPLSDGEVSEIAKKSYGQGYADVIAAMQKRDRDQALLQLHIAGASIRQLERLTGIGRGVIQTAVKSRR